MGIFKQRWRKKMVVQNNWSIKEQKSQYFLERSMSLIVRIQINGILYKHELYFKILQTFLRTSEHENIKYKFTLQMQSKIQDLSHWNIGYYILETLIYFLFLPFDLNNCTGRYQCSLGTSKGVPTSCVLKQEFGQTHGK